MKRIRRTLSRRLAFEVLEGRQLLSVTPPSLTFLDGNGSAIALDAADYVAGREAAQSATLPGLGGTLEMFLTTTGDPATRITPVGTGFDGVIELRLYPDISNLNSFIRGTATLLPNGRDLLTAAHLFTDPIIQRADAFFTTATGVTQVLVTGVWVHPNWTGNSLNSPDIALAHLAAVAPGNAQRYDIYRGANELNQAIVTAGYGRSGTGVQGSVLAGGTKRDGQNRIDAFGEALNGTVYAPGTITVGTHLVFDFDDGTAAHDASGFFLGVNNVGLGAFEVSTAPGDSGGPAFINGQIAGITSFGRGFNGSTDVLAGTNSSFGEFAVDTRVSHYSTWIDSTIDIIAPNAPSAPNLDDLDDTGFFNSDNVTRLTTLHFTGTAEPGATVELMEGATVRGTAIANAGGGWTITATLANGVHNLTARATDAAGNVSALSSVLQVTIDTQRPRAFIEVVSDPSNLLLVPRTTVGITFTNESSGLPESDIFNFTRDDLRLIVNVDVNLLPGSQATLAGNNGSWTLDDLDVGGIDAPTASPGFYTLSIRDQSLAIQDRAGNSLLNSNTSRWSQKLTYAKTTNDNVPFQVRMLTFNAGQLGIAEISGNVTSGSVTLAANSSSITKTGTGTLVIDRITSPYVVSTFEFNANEGTTTFTADPGNSSVANWTLNVGANVGISVAAGHHWNDVTIGTSGVLTNSAGTITTGSLMFLEVAAPPDIWNGGTVVHDSDTMGTSVSVTINGVTISGTIIGSVYLVDDTSDAMHKLRKFGSGTFQLTGVSDRTVPINFRNEEGETEFHTNVGDTAISGGVNWNVIVREMPGSSASSVEFHTSQNLASLDIGAGGVATVATSTAPNYKALVVGSLSIAENGTLDLTNNGFVLDYAATLTQDDKDLLAAQVRSWLVSGRGGIGIGEGTWDGWGITSSTAAAANASNPESRSVGYGVNLAMPLGSYSTFLGQTVDTSSLITRFTVMADLTLDGTVNDDDVTVQAAYYGAVSTGDWITGDLDYDGDVDDDDVTLLGASYGQSI